MTHDTDQPQPSATNPVPGATEPLGQTPQGGAPSSHNNSWAMRRFGATVASIVLVGAVVYAVAWLSADRLPGNAKALPIPGQGVAPRQGQGIAEPPPFQWPPGSKVVPERATGKTPGFRFAEVPGNWEEVRDAFLRQIRRHKWGVIQKPTRDGSRGVTLFVEKAGWTRIIGIRQRPAGRMCTVSIGNIVGGPSKSGAGASDDMTEGK